MRNFPKASGTMWSERSHHAPFSILWLSCEHVLQSCPRLRSHPNCYGLPPCPPLPSSTAGQCGLITQVNTPLTRDRTISSVHWPPHRPSPPSAHRECPTRSLWLRDSQNVTSAPLLQPVPTGVLAEWHQTGFNFKPHSFFLLKALLSSTMRECSRGTQGTTPRRQEHRTPGVPLESPQFFLHRAQSLPTYTKAFPDYRKESLWWRAWRGKWGLQNNGKVHCKQRQFTRKYFIP